MTSCVALCAGYDSPLGNSVYGPYPEETVPLPEDAYRFYPAETVVAEDRLFKENNITGNLLTALTLWEAPQRAMVFIVNYGMAVRAKINNDASFDCISK